jgi:hypothetical protein
LTKLGGIQGDVPGRGTVSPAVVTLHAKPRPYNAVPILRPGVNAYAVRILDLGCRAHGLLGGSLVGPTRTVSASSAIARIKGLSVGQRIQSDRETQPLFDLLPGPRIREQFKRLLDRLIPASVAGIITVAIIARTGV